MKRYDVGAVRVRGQTVTILTSRTARNGCATGVGDVKSALHEEPG